MTTPRPSRAARLPGLRSVDLHSFEQQLLDRPLPSPPEALRRGPFRTGDGEPGPAHDVRSAALLGRALGIVILVCFVTGLISHVHQNPPSWLDVPSRPVWGYQVSQGIHVIFGIAAVPLVLAKLWVVYHRFFTWPPARTVGHALERLLIAPLVAGMLFQVTSGLLNIVQWYPYPFFFPRVHGAVAWVVVGSLLIHVAVKAPQIRAGLAARHPSPTAGQPAPSEPAVGRKLAAGQGTSAAESGTDETGILDPADPDRRAVLFAAAGAVGAVTLLTAGQTVPFLRGVSLLAARDPAVGEQGLPVNRTAMAAGIATRATSSGWRLSVAGAQPFTASLAELAAMPQHESVLPIACVEGWSATATWSGVRLSDLLDRAGVPHDRHLRAISLEDPGWLYAASPLGPSAARDPLTLLALRLNGQPLTLDHGFPLRLIAPNRPGVQQTKWLTRIEVV